MRINGDLYQGFIFFLILVFVMFFVGWLYLQFKFCFSLVWFKNVEFCFNYYLVGLFGVSFLVWIGYLVYVVILEFCGQYVGWDNFLIIMFYFAGLGLFFMGNWGVYV